MSKFDSGQLRALLVSCGPWAMKRSHLDCLAAGTFVATGTNHASEYRRATSTARIAVLNLSGVILQHPGFITEYGFGTSTTAVGKLFDSAMADHTVKEIILNIDSPGGSVAGVQELAEKIYSARGRGKRITAVANSMAASAAYWIGSAADQLWVTPSGEVGSIGVYSAHIDQSKLDENLGVKVTYINAGKYKVEGNAHEPLSDSARQYEQSRVNDYYRAFVDAVAKHRRTTAIAVRSGFGEGRVVGAQQAKTLGMADAVGTLEDVIYHRALKQQLAEAGIAPKQSLSPKEENARFLRSIRAA